MRTLSKYVAAAFLGTVMLASCSRPVAYFQPSAREQFKSAQPAEVAVVRPSESVQPAETVAVPVAVATPVTPAEQLAQAKQAVSQMEAYVRNDNKLASNKKLAKRITRLNELMTTAGNKAVTSTNEASAKKLSFMERTMLKKMDKKIKNHVAPDQTKATSNTRLGLIVGVVGLILVLVGAIAGSGAVVLLGLIGLIVGLVLLLVGLAAS